MWQRCWSCGARWRFTRSALADTCARALALWPRSCYGLPPNTSEPDTQDGSSSEEVQLEGVQVECDVLLVPYDDASAATSRRISAASQHGQDQQDVTARLAPFPALPLRRAWVRGWLRAGEGELMALLWG